MVTPKETVLITGGARRIGKALSQHLAKQGKHIALHYHSSKQDAQRTAKQIEKSGAHCSLFPCNLQDSKETEQLINRVLNECPKLTCVINNASMFAKSTFLKASIEDLDRDLSIHLKAPFILTQQFARLVGKGNVINLLDTHISDQTTDHFTYLLAKKSLQDLTEMTALALAPDIRVNAIAPGLILPPEKSPAGHLQRLAHKVPLRKKGHPDNIIQAVRYLMDNTYVTGQTLYVDGGEHLT